jgi:GAF domain-containing protein
MDYKVQVLSAAELLEQQWVMSSRLDVIVDELREKYPGKFLIVWRVEKHSCVLDRIVSPVLI